MAPRIRDIQAHLIALIHDQKYAPSEPPTKTIIFSIPCLERERLEFYGDSLLSHHLVSFLFHQFPTKGPGFMSNVKAALLSNHTFTNILLKAQGYSDPAGFPVDKAVADAFETMAALLEKEWGARKFQTWWDETFIILVNEAAALWDRADNSVREEDSVLLNKKSPTSSSSIPQSSGISAAMEDVPIEAAPKKSWVDSCIEAAALPTDRIPFAAPVCIPQIPRRRRRRDEGPEDQPFPKRRWAEAMEAAGPQNVPPHSSWVEAMARTANPELAPALALPEKKTIVRAVLNPVSAKENCLPVPTADSRRRRTRWDVYALRDSRPRSKYRDRGSPFMSSKIGLQLSEATNSLEPYRASQVAAVPQLPHAPILSALPTPSSPIQRIESSFARDLLEPLHIDPSTSLVQLPPLDSTCTIADCRDESWSRAGTCSPMGTSPNCSPTKFTISASPHGNRRHSPAKLFLGDADSLAPFLDSPAECESGAFHIGPNSTCSSHMVISPCSSPTKFVFPPSIFGQESALTPTNQHPPDILCASSHRWYPGTSGLSSDAHLSGTICSLTSSPIGTHNSEVMVAKSSTFWPGKTVAFTYKQRTNALQLSMNLE